MSDELALFEVDPAQVKPPPPPDERSAGQRRTARQRADAARGLNPLIRLFAGMFPHPDAPQVASPEDRATPGPRCGSCRFRELVSWHSRSYPKCTFGEGVRMSHSDATDVRGWWPACRDYELGDPALGPDAMRHAPDGEPS